MAMYLGDKPVKAINQDIVGVSEAFITRQTAGGLTVVDPSPAIVQKIQGGTAKCENLLNIFGRTKGERGAWENSSIRNLNENEYHIGLSRNNYYHEGYYNQISVSFIENGFHILGGGNAYGINFPMKCYANTKYAVSFKRDADAGMVGCGFYAPDGTFLGFTDGFLKSPFNITTPENCALLTLVFVADGVTFTNIMLNEGTTALPYEPYFSGLKHTNFQKIVSTGRNLFNINNLNCDVVYNESGYWFPQRDYNNNAINIQVESGKKYTITAKVTTTYTDGVGSKLNFAVLAGKDQSYYSGAERLLVRLLASLDDYTVDGTFSIPEGINFVSIAFMGKSIGYKDFMLNEGDTALPYEPYTSNEFTLSAPVELGKWDYILPQTGELVRGTNTITLTGEEPFAGGEIGENGWGGVDTVGFYTYFKKNTPSWAYTIQQPNPIRESADWYCNKFTCYSSLYGDTSRTGFMANTSYLAFRVSRSLLTEYGSDNSTSEVNKTAFKAWLADMYAKGDPVIVSYEIMDEFKTIEKLDCPKQYTAYNGGSETVMQGETDNGEYGALVTVDNKYVHGSTVFTAPIKKCVGKNLFNPSEYAINSVMFEDSFTSNGITATKNSDGSMTIKGTATGNVYVYWAIRKKFTKGTYTFSTISNDSTVTGLYVEERGTVNSSFSRTGSASVTRTYTEDKALNVLCPIRPGTTVDVTIYNMIQSGDASSPYEPYTEWYEY